MQSYKPYICNVKILTGNWKKVYVKSCFNIEDEWEGAALSIKAYNDSCVSLFTRKNCTGKRNNVISSNANLREQNFDGVTRSLQPCSLTSIVIGSQALEKGSGGNNMTEGNSNIGQTYNAGLSPGIIAGIAVAPIVAVIMSVVVVLFVMKKCSPWENVLNILSEKEIQEFLQGIAANEGFLGGTDTTESEVENGEVLAQNTPYNEAYEVTRSNIQIGKSINPNL